MLLFEVGEPGRRWLTVARSLFRLAAAARRTVRIAELCLSRRCYSPKLRQMAHI